MVLSVAILLVVLGLCLGSFLGAFVTRYVRNEKVTRGRSHCDFCNHPLSFQNNIPLLSWIYQRGHCSYCNHKLGPFYPFIELSTGVTFVSLFLLTFQNNYKISDVVILVLTLVIASTLIIIFFSDLKFGIIPDVAVVIGVVSTLLLRASQAYFGYGQLLTSLSEPANKLGQALIKIGYLTDYLTGYHLYPFLWDVGAALGLALFFTLLILVTKGRGMGWGDVKFAVLLGLIVGWPNLVIATFIAFVSGALWSVVLIILNRKTIKQTIHFGPFLVLSIPVTLLWGQKILEWYVRLK